jgi:hypothetical protein
VAIWITLETNFYLFYPNPIVDSALNTQPAVGSAVKVKPAVNSAVNAESVVDPQ